MRRMGVSFDARRYFDPATLTSRRLGDRI